MLISSCFLLIQIIPGNPADKVERPKKEKFSASFYDADEINKLFEISKGTKLEIPILLGAFYGLRRSEAIGLKWEAIDFEANTIANKHTVTSVNLNGKHILVPQDTTKTKSSRRTLPLVPFVNEQLLSLQKEQKENRRLCGHGYNREFEVYICVNEIGDIIKPEYVSSTFAGFLEAQNSPDHFPRPPSFLRFTDALKRSSHEADSGLARPQRLFHDGEHLCPPGIQLQDFLSRRDAYRAWDFSS